VVFRPRIEYAVGVLRVPGVIVCGHTDCGVMRGALHPEALEGYPNVTTWLRCANVYHREAEPSAEFLLALTEDNVVAQLKTCAHIPRLRLDWNKAIFPCMAGSITSVQVQ